MQIPYYAVILDKENYVKWYVQTALPVAFNVNMNPMKTSQSASLDLRMYLHHLNYK